MMFKYLCHAHTDDKHPVFVLCRCHGGSSPAAGWWQAGLKEASCGGDRAAGILQRSCLRHEVSLRRRENRHPTVLFSQVEWVICPLNIPIKSETSSFRVDLWKLHFSGCFWRLQSHKLVEQNSHHTYAKMWPILVLVSIIKRYFSVGQFSI